MQTFLKRLWNFLIKKFISARQEEMSHPWLTTVPQSIRKSCMYLGGCSPATAVEAKYAVMLCTSSTLNMNCGTSPLWRVTVLFPGLGQCSSSYHLGPRTCLHGCEFIPKHLLLCIWCDSACSCLYNRHSATLLPGKLVIFGGRKTAAFLNDLHVLDLGSTRFAT